MSGQNGGSTVIPGGVIGDVHFLRGAIPDVPFLQRGGGNNGFNGSGAMKEKASGQNFLKNLTERGSQQAAEPAEQQPVKSMQGVPDFVAKKPPEESVGEGYNVDFVGTTTGTATTTTETSPSPTSIEEAELETPAPAEELAAEEEKPQPAPVVTVGAGAPGGGIRQARKLTRPKSSVVLRGKGSAKEVELEARPMTEHEIVLSLCDEIGMNPAELRRFVRQYGGGTIEIPDELQHVDAVIRRLNVWTLLLRYFGVADTSSAGGTGGQPGQPSSLHVDDRRTDWEFRGSGGGGDDLPPPAFTKKDWRQWIGVGAALAAAIFAVAVSWKNYSAADALQTTLTEARQIKQEIAAERAKVENLHSVVIEKSAEVARNTEKSATFAGNAEYSAGKAEDAEDGAKKYANQAAKSAASGGTAELRRKVALLCQKTGTDCAKQKATVVIKSLRPLAGRDKQPPPKSKQQPKK